jgi:hypothetical protein
VDEVDPRWRFVAIAFEGDPVDLGGGVNPWQHEWTSTNGRFNVAHPSYPDQRHTMFTHELVGANPVLRFAAGEYSNGVWGFFVPHQDVSTSPT